MNTKIFCPICYEEYQSEPLKCTKCEYPFSGSELEKHHFVSNHVKGINITKEAHETTISSRHILFVIGGINLIISLYLLFKFPENFVAVPTLIFSLVLIGLGFLSYKDPFFALLLGFISLILLYGFFAIISPSTLFSGIIFKIIFIVSFIAGLIKIRKSEIIKK